MSPSLEAGRRSAIAGDGQSPGAARPRVTVTVAPHLAALRRCWHPVAYSHDVGDRPHAATLLGEPLVLTFDAVAVAYRRAMRAYGFAPQR